MLVKMPDGFDVALGGRFKQAVRSPRLPFRSQSYRESACDRSKSAQPLSDANLSIA